MRAGGWQVAGHCRHLRHSNAALGQHRQHSPAPPHAALWPVCRYLRATGGDARHALRRIRDTLAWRREERPEGIVCTACAANRKSHYMQVVGHDLVGRPCIYSCLALATNRDVEDNRK